MMRVWVEQHVYAILATVIFHLILAIIFMVVKIRALPERTNQPVLITFEQPPPPPQEKKPEENLVPDEELQKMLHNIPVNEAMKKDENMDVKKYIDMVKEEMIKEGKLDRNNYIDEQHRLEAETEKELTRPLPLKEEEKPGDSLAKAELEAAKYAGPTRVKYYLPGRYARDVVIPIYKCEGSGTVVVNIVVDRSGRVVQASIDTERSETSPCMHQTALRAARLSLFNTTDLSGPEKQNGTITYYFVPQG